MSENKENMEFILYSQMLGDTKEQVRMRGLKKLKIYLKNKSKKQEISFNEFFKIWQGLYSCMYMADKPFVQENLADEISELIHKISDAKQKILFFKAAVETFSNQWNFIDKYRMDKFFMLFTRTFRQALIFLKNEDWSMKVTRELVKILETSIVAPFDDCHKKPFGLKLHFLDILLEELAKIGQENLATDVIIAFILPYVTVLAINTDNTYVKAVERNIFEMLIRQSEEGVEKGEDLDWNEVEYRVESENGADVESGEKVNENRDKIDEDLVLDPRAGGVDVCLPQLKPDFSKLSKILQTIGAAPEITSKKRKILYFYANKLENLSGGVYPLPELRVKADVGKKTKALNEPEFREDDNFISESTKAFLKRKKIAKKRIKKIEAKILKPKSTKQKISKEIKKKFRNNKKLAEKVSMCGSVCQNVSDDKKLNLKIKNEKKSLLIKKAPKEVTSSKKKIFFEEGKWILKSDNLATNDELSNKVRSENFQNESKNVFKNLENEKKVAGYRKRKNNIKTMHVESLRKKIRGENNFENFKSNFELKADNNYEKNSTFPKKLNKKRNLQKNSTVKDDDPWSQPLVEGETEFFVASKKFQKKITLERKKSAKTNLKKLRKPDKSGNGKTFKINLKKNQEHDIQDYKKVLKSSPAVPYSAHRRPKVSALKSSPIIKTLKNVKKKYNL